MKQKLNSILSKNSVLGSIFIILAVILFIQADRRFGYTSAKEKENVNIISDGTGYYAYLPQFFIYHHKKNYSFIADIEKKYPDKLYGSMLKSDERTNKRYNKFYVGTAILQAPFFLIAHSYEKLNHYGADGYSKTYRLLINLGAIFYWLVACIALFKLFERMGYSRIHILLGIIFISFGTNLNYYISYYPSYSHIYSFATISLFLSVAHSWSLKYRRKHLIYMALLFSLAAIIRPVNVLIIIILPFLFPSFKSFLERLKTILSEKKMDFIIAIGILCAVLSIQLFVNIYQSGTWSLYTYRDEGFSNALNPQWFNVLFSYQKGLFVYAPILILSLVGIFFMARKQGTYFLFGWSLTLVAIIYTVSSWWSWTYGGGLGMRPFIEFFPLFLIPILALLSKAPKVVKLATMCFAISTIYIYQIFQIQYNRNIIAYSSMNKSKFWEVFMKTDGRYGWMLDYKYDKLPENHGFKTKVFMFQDDAWVLKETHCQADDESSVVKEKIIIQSKSNLPNYGRLSGDVAIHDPANNPTLNTEYYRNGKLLKFQEQPFGNKIHKVNVLSKIQIDADITLVPNSDSVVFELKHYGASNTYKNLKLTFFSDSSGK